MLGSDHQLYVGLDKNHATTRLYISWALGPPIAIQQDSMSMRSHMISMSLHCGSHEPATFHPPPTAFGMAPIAAGQLTVVNDYRMVTHHFIAGSVIDIFPSLIPVPLDRPYGKSLYRERNNINITGRAGKRTKRIQTICDFPFTSDSN